MQIRTAKPDSFKQSGCKSRKCFSCGLGSGLFDEASLSPSQNFYLDQEPPPHEQPQSPRQCHLKPRNSRSLKFLGIQSQPQQSGPNQPQAPQQAPQAQPQQPVQVRRRIRTKSRPQQTSEIAAVLQDIKENHLSTGHDQVNADLQEAQSEEALLQGLILQEWYQGDSSRSFQGMTSMRQPLRRRPSSSSCS